MPNETGAVRKEVVKVQPTNYGELSGTIVKSRMMTTTPARSL